MDPHDLSKYYRLLGYYYIEQNKLGLAYALYALSIYYENNEMAHNEIDYIKQKLGNPDYKISTKEIISLLERENISQSITQENLAKLRELSLEKEIADKQPDLLKFLNSIIDKMATPINQEQEIEGLEVSMPKITSEDIFDENKFILDDADKLRIKKNIEYLKQNNIPYLEQLKSIPINSNTKLMDKKDVFDRALSEYVVASMASYALLGKSSSILNILDEMDAKLQVKKVLTNGDISDIYAIYEGKVPKQQLQDVSWMFEGCALLLWTLGLFKKPSSNQETNVNELDELFFNSTYDDLLSKSNLLPKEEIMEFADLIFRYQWACRETRLKNQSLSNLNELIVQEQRRELEWILNWNIESIMKENIHVKYEKDDFNFELDVPTMLNFSNVSSNRGPQRLFSFINSDNTIAIDFTDLGKGISLDVAFDRDIKYYESNGFDIIGKYDLTANNLKSKVKYLIANKKVENKLIGTSKYYFVLNNHNFCMECMILDNNVNYQDVSSIQNSKVNRIMTGLLFSLCEKGEGNINQAAVDIAKMMNYELHAKQLDIPILNNFKVENNDDPKIILLATDDGYVETLVSDGTLNQNETFEQRINFVNKDLIEFLKKQSPLNNEKCIFYYKDYTNGIFDYKIYVEEMFFEVKGVKKVIRQLVAYFIEPRFNDFYQLTISSPALQIPTEILKLGVVDLENDQITKKLYLMLQDLMDNLKYKSDELNGTSYQDSMNMNGVEVPYNMGEGDTILADPNQLYKAAIESSVIENLSIDSSDSDLIDNVKNLYRIILVCGEFENPILDENNLEKFLLDNDKVINLVRKFKEINQREFKNELSYLTFDVEDDSLLNKLIDMLRKSFRKNLINDNLKSMEEVNMDFYDEEKEVVINNEFNYSNIIPTVEHIGTLVQYCESVYNQLLKLIEEDEQKNEKLKLEYKNYKYAKSYGERFEVSIYEKTYNNISCKTYNSYIDAVNNGQLKEVDSLRIKMDLDYRRGLRNNLKTHENSFIIVFKPYEIKFVRKSNFNDENMTQIENTINQILQQFDKANSIFCTK